MVILIAFFNKGLEPVGTETMETVVADIGAHIKVCAGFLHLILKDDKILIPETGYKINFHAGLMQGLGNGIGNGAAGAAADNGDLLAHFGNIGGDAQRSDKVMQAFACLLYTSRCV